MKDIVDVHVHVYPPELIRDQEIISQTEPHFDLLTHNRVHKWGDADQLVSRMDETGVTESWIFGFAFRDLGLCRLCNDYVIDAVNRYPTRLKGFCVVPPLAQGACAEVERCADLGCIGVGELFPQGHFDLADKSCTTPLVRCCQERDMILKFHTAEPVGHDYDGKGNVGPKEAAQFCVNHPDVKVVFAHFGGGLWLYESMPELKKALRNARYDTAAWPFLYDAKVLSAAWAAGTGKKLLFGTDWPILDLPRFVSRIEGSGLSDEEQSDFLAGNARAFLEESIVL